MKKCTTVFGATVLTIWTAAAQEVPKVQTYLGYEYVRFNSATNVPAFSANGAGGQFIYNFNNWIGAVADVGAVHNGNIGGFRLDNTFTNFMVGPRFSLRYSRIEPYFQTLFGGVHGSASTRVDPASFVLTPTPHQGVTAAPILGGPVSGRFTTSQTAFAMALGGGFDIKITKHVSFRPIGLDYYMTRLKNLRTAGDNNQNNLRYSTGFTFSFGGERASPPLTPSTKSCPDGSTILTDQTCPLQNMTVAVTATPSELCPGDTAHVTASVSGASQSQLNYAWSIDGTQISQGPTLEFGASGRPAGDHTVSLNVNGDGFNPARGAATITVREYRPPTGTVKATPSLIHAQDKSALSADFQGQCGGPIQAATYEASEGSIVGDQFDSSTVQFDPTNNAEQRKTITITAKAADKLSVGAATTTVDVVKEAVIAPIRLPDVLFSPNNSRVNNCGKRILLEQLRAYYERDSSGSVIVVGHVSSDEKSSTLAQERALNAAAVITAGTGVCLAIPQSQVQVSSPGVAQNGVSFEAGFCQSSVTGAGSTAAEMRRVEVWFVPSGGKLPASVTNSQASSVLNVGSLGCPK